MRTRLSLPILLFLAVAGCDSGASSSEDDPTPLRYFAATTDVLARVDAGAGADFALSFADATLDLSALLDSLGLAPADVQHVFAATILTDDGTAETAQVVVTTRLGPDVLLQRARELAGTQGQSYGGGVLVATQTRGALGVRGSDMLLAASAAQVRAMLDRAATGDASLAGNPDIRRLSARLEGSLGGLVARDAATLLDAALGDTLAASLPLALPVSHAALAVPPQNLTATTPIAATVWLQPSPGTSADVLVGALATVRALAAASPDLDPAAAQILAAMQITADAPDVRLDLRIPLTSLLPGGSLRTRP